MNAIFINCTDRKKHKDEVRDALTKLKTTMKKEGVLTEYRDRTAFRTNSERARIKRNRSAIQRRKDKRTAEKQQR